jgi:hypothetical protein
MYLVYGYEAHYYYIDNEIYHMETFLKVAAGYGSGYTGYVKISDYLTLDQAYMFNIY